MMWHKELTLEPNWLRVYIPSFNHFFFASIFSNVIILVTGELNEIIYLTCLQQWMVPIKCSDMVLPISTVSMLFMPSLVHFYFWRATWPWETLPYLGISFFSLTWESWFLTLLPGPWKWQESREGERKRTVWSFNQSNLRLPVIFFIRWTFLLALLEETIFFFFFANHCTGWSLEFPPTLRVYDYMCHITQ